MNGLSRPLKEREFIEYNTVRKDLKKLIEDCIDAKMDDRIVAKPEQLRVNGEILAAIDGIRKALDKYNQPNIEPPKDVQHSTPSRKKTQRRLRTRKQPKSARETREVKHRSPGGTKAKQKRNVKGSGQVQSRRQSVRLGCQKSKAELVSKI